MSETDALAATVREDAPPTGDTRALVKQEHLDRRERMRALKAIAARYPGSRRASRISPLLLDQDILDDRIAECGGDEEFLFFFTAQIMSGVTARDFCQHYVLQEGLLGAWLMEEPDRLARYELALKWVADGYVSETIGIADDGENDTYTDEEGNVKVNTDVIARSKLRVDTRLKVAGVLDRKRFGTEKASSGAPVSIHFDAGLVGAAAELLAKIRQPVVIEQGEG